MEEQADAQPIGEVYARELSRGGAHERQVAGSESATKPRVRTALRGHEHMFASRSRPHRTTTLPPPPPPRLPA